MKEHAPQAQILFDRFHIVKHLNDAVEEVRRSEMRRLSAKEKVPFKRSRWLLLKNPWNLSDDQKERLSTLVRWNAPGPNTPMWSGCDSLSKSTARQRLWRFT